MKYIVAFVIGMSIVLVGCTSNKGNGHNTEKELHRVKWGYKGDIGPDRWGDLSPEYKLCKTGKNQSPIDIRNAKKEKLPKINFNYQDSILNITNSGYTIQLKYDKGSYVKYEDKKCDLLQLHFHTPSEHLINGRAFPMEAHLVHKCDDGKLLIIGVMVRQGKEHSLIKDIWTVMPEKAGESVKVDVKINAKGILPKDRSYYAYSGSLTIPPCSEDVTWIIMKESIEVSSEQISRFRELYDVNSRPVQPINDRIIKESS